MMQNIFAGLRIMPDPVACRADYIIDDTLIPRRKHDRSGCSRRTGSIRQGHNLEARLASTSIPDNVHLERLLDCSADALYEYTPCCSSSVLRAGFRNYDGIPQNDIPRISGLYSCR